MYVIRTINNVTQSYQTGETTFYSRKLQLSGLKPEPLVIIRFRGLLFTASPGFFIKFLARLFKRSVVWFIVNPPDS